MLVGPYALYRFPLCLYFVMPGPSEIEYLKSLVSQLNEKIAALEAKSKGPATPTPAKQLRTILIGPPGAGTCHFGEWNAWWKESHEYPNEL